MKIGISSYGMYSLNVWEMAVKDLFGDGHKVVLAEKEDDIDILMFDGGSDINPKLYNQNINHTTYIHNRRDEHEVELFNKFYPTKTLFAGICRGCQLLNVLLGGTLIQDLYNIGVQQGYKHPVNVTIESQIMKYIIKERIIVNSIHHQAVDKLGKDCIITLVDDNGIIEGIETLDGKVRAVQCHPEMGSFEYSDILLRYLFRM